MNQEAFDSMTARCATLQNKVFDLQEQLAVLAHKLRKQEVVFASCSKLSKDLSKPPKPIEIDGDKKENNND